MASRRLLCLALYVVGAHSLAMHQQQKQQRTIDSDDDACSGCEFTVDLRCAGIRSKRSAPFHRIQDCLVPLYGLIKVAKDNSLIGSAKVCAITWLVNYEGLNLEAFLVNVSGVSWHKIIDEREACSKNLTYHALNRSEKQMATAEWVEQFAADKNVIKAYDIDMTANLLLLQEDSRRLKDGDDAHIIMIHRKKTELVGRAFRPIAFEDLSESLRSSTNLPLVTYSGDESVMDTVKLFEKTAGVIGYHGAAWVNTYFAGRPHCNMQISTFFDLDGKEAWRISDMLMINPLGVWYFYHIPLNMLLDANHVQHDAYVNRKEKDHFIKDLEWIPLRSVDIAHLSSNMALCTKDPQAYNASHPTPNTLNATQGWNSNLPSSVAPYIPEGERFTPTRNDCTGCDVTVDLRCSGLDKSRNHYYNRLVDCLLPMYEMIQLARESSSNSSAHVCAITWSDTDGLDLKPFLTDLVDIKWFKIIDETSDCVQDASHKLLYYAANRTYELGAIDAHLKAFGQDKNIIQAYPINMATNVGWMFQDAINIAGKPSPKFIVLQQTSTNIFFPEIVQAFQTKIKKLTKYPVTVYDGSASLLETIKLFNHAGGIVGFYGNAWANELFSSYPHCPLQYSTYQDFNKTIEWRLYNLSSWNELGNWQFLRLPLYQLLSGNNISANAYRKVNETDHDQFIANLTYINLTEYDIVSGVSRLYVCWQNKMIPYRRAMDYFGKSGNNLRKLNKDKGGEYDDWDDLF